MQMEPKNKLTEAEKYRLERKERIKKDAARRTKGSGKAGKVAGKVVSIILIAALCIGAVWFVADFFGWPQKLTTVATVQVDGKNQSVKRNEFAFYYTSAYISYINTYQQYGTYASLFGLKEYDPDLSAEEQTRTDADGNEITFSEYFTQSALSNIARVRNLCAEAKKAGFSLNEEQLAEIEGTIDSIKTTIASYQQPISVSAYIINYYGKGLNERLFRKYLTEQETAEHYTEFLAEQRAADVPEADVNAAYEKAPDDYDIVDLRLYRFDIPKDEDGDSADEETDVSAEETVKARAEEMISRVTDEASFNELILEYCSDEERAEFAKTTSDISLANGMSYSTMSSNMGSELANWAFADGRQAGDTTTGVNGDYVYALYILKPQYKNEYHYTTVRHLLVSLPTEETETETDGITEVTVGSDSVPGETVTVPAEDTIAADRFTNFKRS